MINKININNTIAESMNDNIDMDSTIAGSMHDKKRNSKIVGSMND
jgi:hypothetical protein